MRCAGVLFADVLRVVTRQLTHHILKQVLHVFLVAVLVLGGRVQFVQVLGVERTLLGVDVEALVFLSAVSLEITLIFLIVALLDLLGETNEIERNANLAAVFRK